MKKARTGVTGLIVLCALSAGIFAFYCRAPVQELSSAAASAGAAVSSTASVHTDAPKHLALFPEVDESGVTALTVRSEDISYEFLRDAPNDVSINGQKADSEAFDTLLCQIVTLPVSVIETFSVSESPTLTVCIVSGGKTHTASFYHGSSENTALILCGSPEEPVYRQTSAWRVGTLLLTCEGTRIQDESGNETPAQ